MLCHCSLSLPLKLMKMTQISVRFSSAGFMKLSVCQNMRGAHKLVSSVSFHFNFSSTSNWGLTENSAVSALSLLLSALPISNSLLNTVINIPLFDWLGFELIMLLIVCQIISWELMAETQFEDHLSYTVTAATHVHEKVKQVTCEHCMQGLRPFLLCVQTEYCGQSLLCELCTNCHWGGQGTWCSLCEYVFSYWYEEC